MCPKFPTFYPYNKAKVVVKFRIFLYVKEMEMLDELRNLSGGPLQMWRRQHREEILAYLAEHGEAETMEQYRFCHTDAFRRFIEHEPLVRFRCDRFTKQDKTKLLAEVAIAGTRENQKEIRHLKELYQAFVDQVGTDINKKLFLPLLRLCIKLDNPIFDLPPDKLSLDGLFGDKPAEPPQLQAPGESDVVGEAEAILEPSAAGPGEQLEDRIEAAKVSLIRAYEVACEGEDYYAALAIQMWLRELDCIYELDAEDEFPANLEEWLSKAQAPDELVICY